MPKPLEQSQKTKASRSEPIKLGFAPWIEDFDPPDLTTDEEIEAMAEGIAKRMEQDKRG